MRFVTLVLIPNVRADQGDHLWGDGQLVYLSGMPSGLR